MEKRFVNLYMDIAKRTAQMSRAVRLNVGCVIVKDGRVISMSWNGTPAGWDNCCEYKVYTDEGIHSDQTGKYNLVTKPEVLHAERNSLDKLAKGYESGEGASLFVTHSPCLECAKSIYGAGIAEVYYETDYRSTDGVEFLRKCNIPVIKWHCEE